MVNTPAATSPTETLAQSVVSAGRYVCRFPADCRRVAVGQTVPPLPAGGPTPRQREVTMGRHHAAPDRLDAAPFLCPRCFSPKLVDYHSKSHCGDCGLEMQADDTVPERRREFR